MDNTYQLEEKLNKALDDFKESNEFNYETYREELSTKDELRELAKQTFYTLEKFRDSIVEFLEKNA